MEQVIYERPREKLRKFGAGSLTNIELLQLVIGSGTGGVSGASLAREVHNLIEKDTFSYQALIELKGIGEAKACQVLSAYELAVRIDKRVYG